MHEELNNIINKFFNELKEFEAKQEVFVEVWRSDSVNDKGIRATIKKTYKY